MWDIGLRALFVLAMASLATACWVGGRLSVLPRAWRTLDIALIGLVALLGITRLNEAAAGVLAGVVLVAAVLTESVGMWLGIIRRRVHAGAAILVIGGTLCVLFASVRLLAAASHAMTTSESVGIAAVLIEGILVPLLIILGAGAIAIGSRGASVSAGGPGILASVLYFVAVLLLTWATSEAVAGEFDVRVGGLICLALVFAGPTLVRLFRRPAMSSV
jgi:hypothetical protein